MVQEYVPVQVDEYTTGGVECWRVLYDKPDGGQHIHVFPKMTLDARAAEYGIDPADTGTLLDIVLHEPFTPQPGDDLFDEAADPAADVVGKVPALESRGTTRAGQPTAPWLFNADSIEQARRAHLARIAHCKANLVRVAAPRSARAGQEAADPLDVIRQAHRPDHQLIASIREDVDKTRRRLRGERVPTALPIPTGQIERGSR